MTPVSSCPIVKKEVTDMSKSFRRSALVVVLVTLSMLVGAAPASALAVSTRQVLPGVSVRTIWDSAQVACYKLPDGVNHNGYIHMELRFKPSWADFDVYLLDEHGQALSPEMGHMASLTGKEVVDYQVTGISDQTLETGDPTTAEDDSMVGDPYYVVVVAFSEKAQYQVWGYYPQIDLSVSDDTSGSDNYYIQSFRKPASAASWATLKGPDYGHPYDFTPTSVGAGEAWLEWPAKVDEKRVEYYPIDAPSPANMEQYMYVDAGWRVVFEDRGDANWTPAPQGEPVSWYGLRDTFMVEEHSLFGRPLRVMHYVPSLYLVAADPILGGLGPPKLGISTMGYKATLVWPENLCFGSAPAKVKKGARATLKGSFALDGAWREGATVYIEKSAGGGRWKAVTKVKTGANGLWTAKVKVTAATSFRARASGNPATGLAEELSVTRRVTVY